MSLISAGLESSDYDREYRDWTLVKRIISYFRPYKLYMLFVIIAVTISGLAGALVPLFISNIVDQLETGLVLDALLILIATVIGASVINFVTNAISQDLTMRAVQGTIIDLRKDAFDALMERDLSFYDDQQIGRLASRVANDTNDFGQTITQFSQFLSQLIVAIAMITILYTVSEKLTILIVAFTPVVLFTANLYRRIARKYSLKSSRILAKVNSLIQESTSGIFIAKSFRAERQIYDEFNKMNQQSYKINFVKGVIMTSIWSAITLLMNLAIFALVYFGALEIIGQENPLGTILSFLPGTQLTVGQWFLFLLGLNLYFFPLLSIASFWSLFQQGLAASERVFSLIDAENSIQQVDNKIIENPQGTIEFDNITFGYNDDITVLEDFSLKIEAGEKIAIVGHTGAGKSTIAKLIARFYEFQGGSLLIDGIDIRELDLEHYRKMLSIINQEVFLWSGTIKENLLYGLPEEEDTEAQVLRVLEKIDALDWIYQLPGGLEAEVGERGKRLSLGQRQLIAFARILLLEPQIFIMDEATASIDPISELLVQRATDVILEGRTSIVIAHRLTTIRKCDRILVMKDGKIIEEGDHNSLMSQQGHYAELYDTYYKHQSLQYIESLVD